MTRAPRPTDPEGFNAIGEGRLPGLLGIEITALDDGIVGARLQILPTHLAPNGYLHAATVIALADTACGYGCVTTLPVDADGFTTAELKANLTGTVTEGSIVCRARPVHLGRTTQVWDAEVTAEATGKVIGLFRCTQMILWPR